ncbi:gliding motility-associated C-terminal domain-containing protein [Chitinophaga pinensis]|nr:gliding motility-associated C-terminal domain-containing protein [Chitinophaga pinensis]
MRSLYLLIAVLITMLGAFSAQAQTQFTYSTTCQNDSVRFEIAEADLAGIDSVRWYFGDLASGAADTSRRIKGAHLYNTVAAYTVQLIAYRAGVPSTSTTNLNIVAPVIYDFGPTDQTLCDSTTITLTAPDVPGATYEWQDGSTGRSILVDSMTTYKVKINGCLIPDSVNIFYTPVPEIDLGDSSLILCLGETIELDATAQNCTYIWNTGATTPNIIVHSDVAMPSTPYIVTADAQGCGLYRDTIYIAFAGAAHPFSLGKDTILCPGESITLDATTPGATGYRWGNRAITPTTTIRSNWDLWVFVEINNTCEVLDTVLIRYKPDRALDLGNDTIVCKGETLVLKADFGTASYRWQDTSKQATFYVRETGYYWVEAKVGRCIDQDTIHVQFEDTLRTNLGHDTLLCMGTVYNLHPDGAGMNYKWQDSSSLPIFPVTQAGHYAIVANNSCGQSIDEVDIAFQECGCQVYLPTAFTPNADGVNDYFRPKFRCPITEFELVIFNRWGQRIYYTTDPDVGWKGTWQKGRVPFGSYVWMMDYKVVSTGEKVKKTGSVTVIY